MLNKSQPIRQMYFKSHSNPTTLKPQAYCSILFLRPKMQIFVRGVKVKTKLIKKSLSKTLVDTYRPHGVDKPQKIVFGFSPESDNYGIMMYYRNRLIRSYVRVGYQLKVRTLCFIISRLSIP